MRRALAILSMELIINISLSSAQVLGANPSGEKSKHLNTKKNKRDIGK
jgi:hypothetical protein